MLHGLQVLPRFQAALCRVGWIAPLPLPIKERQHETLFFRFRLPFMAIWLAHALAPRLAMEIPVNLLCQRAADAVGLLQVVDAGGLHAAQSAEAG